MDKDKLSLAESSLEEVSLGRALKYKMYQLLTGRLVTRRDLMIAGSAGATGFAIERLFGSGITFNAPHTDLGMGGATVVPEIVNAEKFKQSMHVLGKYLYLTPEKLGGCSSPPPRQ
ncbi:MAG: hypothetical protein IAF58_11485 [Leptolyngbya sp.]|nr:hypothetical protein [Candidatus Melainabacteria bacterium]